MSCVVTGCRRRDVLPGEKLCHGHTLLWARVCTTGVAFDTWVDEQAKALARPIEVEHTETEQESTVETVEQWPFHGNGTVPHG